MQWNRSSKEDSGGTIAQRVLIRSISPDLQYQTTFSIFSSQHMSNPYASPVTPSGPNPVGPISNMLGQMKAFAICSIVQGALEILVGSGTAAMGVIMPLSQPTAQGSAPPEVTQILMWMAVLYGVVGGLAVMTGGLRIVAGILNLKLKGRNLMIASLFVGLLNIFTCYCIPTAIGLCVWGCIVYFDNGVSQAFALRKQGLSIAEVEQQIQGPNQIK